MKIINNKFVLNVIIAVKNVKILIIIASNVIIKINDKTILILIEPVLAR